MDRRQQGRGQQARQGGRQGSRGNGGSRGARASSENRRQRPASDAERMGGRGRSSADSAQDRRAQRPRNASSAPKRGSKASAGSGAGAAAGVGSTIAQLRGSLSSGAGGGLGVDLAAIVCLLVCFICVLVYRMAPGAMAGGVAGVAGALAIAGYLVTDRFARAFSRRVSGRGGKVGLSTWAPLLELLVVFIVTVLGSAALMLAANTQVLSASQSDVLPAVFGVDNLVRAFDGSQLAELGPGYSALLPVVMINVLEQCVLLWALVLWLCLRRGTGRRTLGIILLALSVVSVIVMLVMIIANPTSLAAYVFLLSQLFPFALGALASVMPSTGFLQRFASSRGGSPRTVVMAIALIALVVMLLAMIFLPAWGIAQIVGQVLVALACACVLRVVGRSRASRKAPTHTLSPDLYRPIISCFLSAYVWHAALWGIMGSVSTAASCVLSVVLALVLGVVVAMCVELTIRRLLAARRNRVRAAFSRPAPLVLGTWVVCAVLLVAGIAGVAAVPASARANSLDHVHEATLATWPTQGIYDVILIGDSVALGAHDYLQEYFPYGMIDTVGSRQAPAALEAYQGYANAGQAGDTVVFHVGTNGTLDTDQLDNMVATVGSDKQIWFITVHLPAEYEDTDNDTLAAWVPTHQNVHLMDWYKLVEEHPDYVYDDQIHLTTEGRQAFADMVRENLDYVLPCTQNSTFDTVFFGDAVCAANADALDATFTRGAVHCSASMTTDAIHSVLSDYRERKMLRGNQTLVVALGSTPVSQGQLESLVGEVSSGQLWLVNTTSDYPWSAGNDAAMTAVANGHDNVHVINAATATAGGDLATSIRNAMGYTVPQAPKTLEEAEAALAEEQAAAQGTATQDTAAQDATA